jgi:hypothetical protein
MGSVKKNKILHSHPLYVEMWTFFYSNNDSQDSKLSEHHTNKSCVFIHGKARNIEIMNWCRTYRARCSPKLLNPPPPGSGQFFILSGILNGKGIWPFVQVPCYGLNCIFLPAVPHWSHSLQTPAAWWWSCHSSARKATDYGLEGRGSIPGSGKNIFFSIAFTPAPGTTQPAIQWVQDVLSPQVNRTRREAHHSPSGSEVKNGGSTAPLPIRLCGVMLE